ncbi:membrane protein insertase YidC [Pandoraea pulmonicola]|uniref:Membrane protein insertase YidC n=1 Tax=Pandoraea pulmonicola TaxID=93221 RepID=A0AAJ5D0Y6_PANPU|nr:membrane protein insertase YidC [Pandoraea pulmonicola]AJC20509.1 membrane protein insertase YidC [Pandoraea pulmonicola]SUA91070.1 Oxa1Ec [Pandoraea pulmonicola]
MDIKRTVLWVIFALSVVMLFDNWQRANGHSSLFFPTPEVSTPAATGGNKTPANDLPQAANGGAAAGNAPGNAPAAATAQKVRITTDVYEADISTQGGTLSFLALTKWPDAEEADKHVVLFDNTPSQQYFARTGLIGGDFPNHNDIFTLVPGPTTMTGDTLTVKFESPVKGGLQLVRAYTFHRGSYVIDVANTIVNKTDAAIKPTLYMELVRDGREISGAKFSHTFTGPTVYSNDEKFQKITFSDIDKDKAKYIKQSSDGWIGMVQHYFATAWIPKEGAARENYIGKLDNGLYRVGVKEPLASIPAGGTETVDARLFAGPQEEHMLEQIAPGLELTKDYGYFTILAKPLFWLLSKLHGIIGNWGWAIIAVTVIIKLVFFPLSAASYKSMARMKEITPRMQALRERYKSDPQKMNAALMELYKTEKVNPFGGCIPIVIQIPVFIALYWVLLSSVEMRGAPWLGWIHDLSTQDPYYILPVLMAVSMFIQTKLNPTPPDPMQAKMMMFMPLIFSVMFLFLPSGLVLYYVVNNTLSIAQQWSINRMLGTKKEKKAA